MARTFSLSLEAQLLIASLVALGDTGSTQALKKSGNSLINSTIIGSLSYSGTWDASTNTPTIVSGVGTLGQFYKVSVAGNTTIDGNTGWAIGDWIIFNGTTWDKIDNTELVTSVAGKIGAVTLVLDDNTDVTITSAASGDFLRYSGSAWVDSTIQASDIPSGVDALKIGSGVVSNTEFDFLDGVTSSIQTQINGKEASISAGTTAQYWRGDKSWQALNTTVVAEGTNLYHTNARAIASTLTGYTSGAGTVASTDTILQAIQKLNGNDGLKANIASPTFTGTVTTDRVDINTLHAVTSAGIILESNNGTDVALLGAGGGAGATFYGGVVINGTVSASNLSGTNTGDQTNITGNAATVTTNANLTGPITSVGNTTSVASQTGTGSTFAMSVSPFFTGIVTNTGTSSTTQADIIAALRTGSINIVSPYVADGFSPALYFSSNTDNPTLPKAAVFSETTSAGSYIFLGTSALYASGITSLVSISPDSLISSGGMSLYGNRSFVSASNNAYIYHTTALGLVMYGNGTTDDFTLAGATGANIMSVATGTTTARFFGAVNIGGTFTRRSQSGVLSQFQVEGTDFDTSSMSLTANNNSFATTCPAFFFSRSRGTSVGSNTIVQSGDRLGIMLFMGADGSLPQAGGIIQAVVDGAPGAGSMPTKLEFMTSPSGSVSPVVGFTIRSTGAIEINNTVAAAVAIASTHKVTMVIGGTTYYLLATT